MSDIRFALATTEDDPGIRRLLRTNAMPGQIRIRFEREPDYFAGCAAMNSFTHVLVAKEGAEVVAVACRAIWRVFVNGQPENIGYLGQLRVDPRYRGRLIVSRGFRMLRELHEDGRAHGYLTTIIEGNDDAVGVLVNSPRPGMPRYRHLGTLLTLAISTKPSPVPVTLISSAAASDFLLTHGARRNLFPVYSGEPLDFVGVERDGRLAGVAALWDQRAYKQMVIDGYGRLLAFARPLYNAATRITRRPALPKPGSELRNAYASFFCLAEDDPDVARELIAKLLALGAERGLDHVLFGFTARDPLLAAAQKFRAIEYPSAIYTVAWDDGDDLHDRLDSRPRSLELAAL